MTTLRVYLELPPDPLREMEWALYDDARERVLFARLKENRDNLDELLYVVDGCSDGTGAVFGSYRDPAALFSNDMVGEAIFRVPGSSLIKESAGRNS